MYSRQGTHTMYGKPIKCMGQGSNRDAIWAYPSRKLTPLSLSRRAPAMRSGRTDRGCARCKESKFSDSRMHAVLQLSMCGCMCLPLVTAPLTKDLRA